MLLYMVLVDLIKVLDMKIISKCLIVAKGQSILELLVSELGVVYQRADKEAAN